MPAAHSFDYAVIRVVPRVDREEFVNAGVIVYCLARDYLAAKVELDEARVRALAPDAELEVIRRHLESIPRIAGGGEAAGPIGKLSQKERFHWLVSPRSTMVQTSPVHVGLCDQPLTALEHLLDRMVRPPKAK